MSLPEISFIICTYNRAEYVKESMETLLKSEIDPERYELLVIDNNSTDNTEASIRDVQQAHPDHDISYIKEPQQGLSHARNKGIKESGAPILVFVDDDVIVPKNYVANWLSFWQNHPDARCAGGKIEVQFDDPRPSWMSHFLLPLLGHHDHGSQLKKYSAKGYPFGGNMGFKASVFEDFGNFDTDLGRKGKDLKASEEKELFQRIKEANIEIYYVPEAMLYHRVNKSRLTEAYIKKQAVGLGESIAVQNQHKSTAAKVTWAATEGFKWIASLLLFFPYTLTFQVGKAKMLLKFRKWIWNGYESYNKNDKV